MVRYLNFCVLFKVALRRQQDQEEATLIGGELEQRQEIAVPTSQVKRPYEEIDHVHRNPEIAFIQNGAGK